MKAIIVHARYRAPNTRENKKKSLRFSGPNKYDSMHETIDKLLIACGKVKLTIETE